MRSVAPKDYESLPDLQAPAGYILVIRDIDSDTFRLDGTANPKTFVAAVLDESERQFGIELVSILESEDLAASASALYDRHQARLSDVWLELDPFQIEELRRSSLQIDARESLYLSPGQDSATGGAARKKPISRYERLAGSYLRGSSEAGEFRRAYSLRSAYRRYGAHSLRRYREQDPEPPQVDLDDPYAAMLHFSRRVDEFFQTGRGKVLKFVLTVLLLIFIFSLGGRR